MNKEEYFKRMINRICKDYGYDVATAFEGLYLEKNKEIERLNNIIKEAINYIDNNTYYKDHKGHINIDDLYIILQKGSDSNE